MRYLRRGLSGVLLMALTLGLLAWAGAAFWGALSASMAEAPPERPAAEVVQAVNVVTIRPGRAEPVLQTFGEIRAARTLQLRAAAAGRVRELSPSFAEGGRVAEGETLLVVDPSDYEADLDLAGADLAEAEAEEREAARALELAGEELAATREQAGLRRQALERQRGLDARGFGSPAAVETAALEASAARAAVVGRRQALAEAEARIDRAANATRRAEIAVAIAERALADTTITAPFAGVLGDVDLVAGERVAEGEVLARLVDPDALEVAFRLSTAQYARLLDVDGVLADRRVAVELETAGFALQAEGRITREAAEVGEGQTGRRLFARLQAPRGFRPGDFVTVRVAEPPLEGVASLPALAVDAAGTVLVVTDEERLEVAEVALLRRQGDRVLVRADGLAGRRVVAERTPLLGAGLKVRPMPAPPQPPRAAAQAASAPEIAGIADPLDPGAAVLVQLSPERRAELMEFVSRSGDLDGEVKARLRDQLAQDRVPAGTIARLERQMGI